MQNVPYNFTKNIYEKCAQNQNILRQDEALQIQDIEANHHKVQLHESI